jgi:epoxide hydrolase 4
VLLRRLLPPLLAAILLSSCAARRPPGPAIDAVEGPWQHAFVELAGRGDGGAPLRMHYLAAGPVDAPRVVLVHGFPDLSYGWHHVLPDLARDHRVLAPDTRGYGDTDKPDSGYGMREMAGDIAALVTASNVADGRPPDTPVHLVAHDWGAAVCWWVAMDHPGLLLSYTAVSVPHPLGWHEALEEDPQQRRRATYQKQLASAPAASFLSGLNQRQLGRVYRGNLVHPESFTDADLAVYEAAFMNTDDWKPPLRYYQRLATDGEELAAQAEEMPPVSVPVLVLWGAQDRFLFARQAPRSCAFVAPGPCEVEVFEDAGHWVQWDRPDGVVARWRSFVGGLEAP